MASINDYLGDYPFFYYYVGRPRSGKSYLAAKTIKEYRDIRHKANKSVRIYSDLQGLKTDDEIKIFNSETFLDLWRLEDASNKAKTHGSNHDEYFRQRFDEAGYLDCMIILDEVHATYLDADTADDIWTRILTYYGHYDLKIILITQSLDLVPKKFKTVCDVFIWAVSAGNRMKSNVLKYYVFNSYQMRDYNDRISDKVADFSVKMEQDVFDLYSSGSNKLKNSHIGGIFKKAILPFLFMLGLLFFIFNRYSTKDKNDDVVNSSTIQKHISSSAPDAYSVPDVSSAPVVPNNLFYLSLSLIVDNKNYYYYIDPDTKRIYTPRFFEYLNIKPIDFIENKVIFLIPVEYQNLFTYGGKDETSGVSNHSTNNRSSF